MNPHTIEPIAHDQTDLAAFAQGEDAFFGQFDDETLEHALKTVGCNAQDMRQFLRAGAVRVSAPKPPRTGAGRPGPDWPSA